MPHDPNAVANEYETALQAGVAAIIRTLAEVGHGDTLYAHLDDFRKGFEGQGLRNAAAMVHMWQGYAQRA